MEEQVRVLHSHSGIERTLRMPKSEVLVDVKFRRAFEECILDTITYNEKEYLKVPVLEFIRKNGLFKPYTE